MTRTRLAIPARAGSAPGDPVAVARIGGYPNLVVRVLFRRRGIAKQLPTEHGITLYRLAYLTKTVDGRLVAASGLLAMPRGRAHARGIVSWQHGTESLGTNAPSSKHVFHGLLPAAVFAGHGYLLLAPDYLGYGVSKEPHDYYLADHMAAVVSDFIAAAKTVLDHSGVEVPSRLFLTGYSEGGYATLATQRALERAPIAGLSVAASAPVAAAVDLAGLGVAGALAGQSVYCSLYLAWIATTYARAYGEPVTDVLTPEWAARTETLFDGSRDGDATVAALPSHPRDLFNPDFLGAYDAGTDHWFVRRLRENSLLDWSPRAPIRAYYGAADVDVTPPQAGLLQENFRAHGGDATAICVGDVDHDASLLPAAVLLRNWFDELAAEE